MTQLNEIEFWIDLNLPPKMAEWLSTNYKVAAKSFKELGFTEIDDTSVFKSAAQKNNIIIITTKDVDFINLQNDIGAPPKILYLNVGNISNKQLKQIIDKNFNEVIRLFTQTSNVLVEISL